MEAIAFGKAANVGTQDAHVHDIGHGRRASTAAHDVTQPGSETDGAGAETSAKQLSPEERRKRIKAL